MSRARVPLPVFIEPVVIEEIDYDGTGFEFPPDIDMAVEAEMRPGRSPFRPDWELARSTGLVFDLDERRS